ncbi:MAG: hypothetical protein Q9M10_05325, partial [Mariprofundaceae bacterium]|nr:hypothetical protein [Mariprofundaceae bacterium]
MIKANKTIFISCIFSSLMAFSVSVQSLYASVFFERTLDVQTMEHVSFSDIQDVSLSKTQLLLSTQKKLMMINLKNFQLQHQYSLTGKHQLFDKKGISGIAALPLNRTLLVNR